MSEEALNPYAPPAELSPVAEPAGLWTVAGDSLLVRDGARLPRVPLEGDGAANDLTPTARQFGMGPAGTGWQWIGLLPGLGMIAWMAYAHHAGLSNRFLIGCLIVLVVGRLLRRFQAPGGVARVQGFVSLAALRKRAGRNRIRRIVMWSGLAPTAVVFVLLMAEIDGTFSPLSAVPIDLLSPFILLGVGVILSSALWQAFDQGLQCKSARDGWLEIRGVPPASLAVLSRQIHRATPVMRKRRVYTLYQYRLPLAMLADGFRWNPRVLLTLAILKAKRSPRLEQLRYRDREGRELALADADGDLLRCWEAAAGDPRFAGWSAVLADRIDFPAGDLRVEALAVASPDRLHFALLSVTRASTGNFFREIHQTMFRTWTDDGRCVATGDSPMIELLPVSLDFARVRKSSPGDHFQRHLGRLAGRSPVAVDLKEKLREEAEDHHELLQAAGYQSACEDVELPELPDD